MHDPANGLPRISQGVEKLPRYPLSLRIGHQTRRFWGGSNPVCGRYQPDADFFNTLFPSTHSGE